MTEEERIIQAVDVFADAMKKRLIKKMHSGYTGWDSPNCRKGLLIDISADCNRIMKGVYVEKHCVDVANRLMMIWHMENPALRKEGPADEVKEATDEG